MIRLFTGFDERESIGWHAFVGSLRETSQDYMLMPPFSGERGDGSNDFTYGRFRVPERCTWAGAALSCDAADMLLRAPIEELLGLYDKRYAVQVVKHAYRTKHPRKYVGTDFEAPNEDYPCKNWSSLILWNCGHQAHFQNREKLRGTDGAYLHRFAWLQDDEIGELPLEWNWLADEYGENVQAKLLHWTAGIPGFKRYRNAPHANEWWSAAAKVKRGIQ